MLLKHRRGLMVATTVTDIRDLVKVCQHMEKDRLIRLIVNQASFHLPLKTIAEETGCTVAVFEKTIQAFTEAVRDIHREVK